MRTLAATIPLWAWLLLPVLWLGVLVDADGSVFVTDSGAALEGCEPTCCGVSCSACIADSPCSFCATDTPSEWTVTFAAVANGATCIDCTGVGGFSFEGGTGTLGTYTVTQDVSPFFCRWLLNTTGPSWKLSTTDGACSSLHTSNLLTVSITKTSSTNYLFHATSFNFSETGVWFSGTASNSECCASLSANNIFSSYACQDNPPTSTNKVIGINGTVVATPC